MRTKLIIQTALMAATILGITGAGAREWQGNDHANRNAASASSNTFQLATACNDGSVSQSSGSGTCSHHGGESK